MPLFALEKPKAWMALGAVTARIILSTDESRQNVSRLVPVTISFLLEHCSQPESQRTEPQPLIPSGFKARSTFGLCAGAPGH
jgi:hypothetical protein